MFNIVRVRFPLNTWILIGSTTGYGFLHGTNLWCGWIWPPRVVGHLGIDNVIGFVCLLLPWAFIVHFRCQRIVQLLLAGVVCGAFSAFGFFYANAMESPLGASALRFQPFMFKYVVYWAVGLATANLGLTVLARCVGYRIIEQNGLLCGTCGYMMAGRVCSECGNITEVFKLPHSIRYFGIAVTTMLLIAAIGIACMLWRPTQLQRANFVARFGSEGSVHGHMYSDAGIPTWPAVGVFWQVEPSGMLLTWLDESVPDPGQPYMQLQIMKAGRVPAGHVLPTRGEPLIIVNITDPNVAEILRGTGVSQATKASLTKIALEQGWQATRVVSGRTIVVAPNDVGIGHQ